MRNELIEEFNLRVFDESYSRIYKCLSMISEDELWKSPQGNIPCIGCLVLHLCGNARQWILSGIGEAPDNRQRDDEFVIQPNIRKSELIFLLENLRAQINDCFINLNKDKLDQVIKIQGFQVTGFSALIHVIEHFSYHTGQITLLTKLMSSKDTGYYMNMDLNQLN